MLQTFRQTDNTVVLQIKANVPTGEAHARDGAVRHGIHIGAGGVYVELESTTPAPIRADRQVTLVIPIVSAADLMKLHDLRDGVYGLPVRWENDLQAAIDVLVLDVRSKRRAGGTHYSAAAVVQPLS